MIVSLSDNGHLQCSYLGTDPSLFQAPKVDSREINYEELDVEMKELQKIIRDVNTSSGRQRAAWWAGPPIMMWCREKSLTAFPS